VGHVYVEDGHVRRRRERGGERLPPVLGERHLEPLGLEHRGEQATVGRRIVGDEDTIWLRARWVAPPFTSICAPCNAGPGAAQGACRWASSHSRRPPPPALSPGPSSSRTMSPRG